MRILVLQHHPVETAAVFGEVLDERGIAHDTVRPDLGQPVPVAPEGFAGILVMGGPMGVYEEARYPWLHDEDRLLRAALEREVPTLGICLGSQLIARAAGARVAPGPEKEIGWYRLTLSPAAEADPLFAGFPRAFDAFEWHGDVFELPRGAVGLASSARYPLQAFRLGARIYGLLFHLEVTAASVRDMLGAFREEAEAVGGCELAERIAEDLERRTKAPNELARRLFTRYLDLTGVR